VVLTSESAWRAPPLLLAAALGPNTPPDETNTNNDSSGSDPTPRPVSSHEALWCESDIETLQYPYRTGENQDYTQSDSRHPGILASKTRESGWRGCPPRGRISPQ
jgi:hypothetical protein